MKLWNDFLIRIGLKRPPGPRYFELDETLSLKLVALADLEQRPAREVQADMIETGLAHRDDQNELVRRWQSLSVREQQITALTCLGYTNGQIAVRLSISIETVKTHMRNLLVKFDLHGKAQVKKALEKWDFSEWEK